MHVLVESCTQSSMAHKSRHRRACSVLLNQRAKLSLPLEEPYMHGVTKGGKEKKLRGVSGHFPQQLLVNIGGIPQMTQAEQSFYIV
jgi:hypothetical protein